MSKVLSSLLCTVVAISAPKPSKYDDGYYQSVLFHDTAYAPDDEAGNIWKSLRESDGVGDLTKGCLVQLIPNGEDKNGKPKHTVVVVPDGKTPTTYRPVAEPRAHSQQPGKYSVPSNAAPTGIPADKKTAIAAYCEDLGSLYAYCYMQSKGKLEELAKEEETYRSAASSLFIAATRKFNL
ncbi:hypothetical protein L3556_06085 [Candidatus Synechococcus calcipolaris G9]|uniref:Uncharacterized protein n=1 Tax=Candidatus Synechococcus calcipolaris G9 TaxID=1497997 RepID=A0ABT6EXH0_9SYNE|nr:hypothetical protein [Candidatus Synechococcus calcipolaris]MDG2990504.1 hypothetical protein [Candidatus Synechococcus calcipolaris G9]